MKIHCSIIIEANYKKVFEYFSNLRNDVSWREEVKDTKTDDLKMSVVSQIIQDSFLSHKQPHFITVLACIELTPKLVVCETNKESKYWSKSSRQVRSLTEKTTKAIYQLEFDKAVVKHALGFSLPPVIIFIYTKMTMKKYLLALKNILERENRVQKQSFSPASLSDKQVHYSFPDSITSGC